jgi:hypothetical protein
MMEGIHHPTKRRPLGRHRAFSSPTQAQPPIADMPVVTGLALTAMPLSVSHTLRDRHRASLRGCV